MDNIDNLPPPPKEILDKTNLEDNLIIIDEFHNLSSDMITNNKNNKNNKNNMNKILTSKNKIIYMSATPLNTTNYKDIFEENKYELSWTDAIKNNYICDYNFYYPDNNKIIEKINNLKVDIKLIKNIVENKISPLIYQFANLINIKSIKKRKNINNLVYIFIIWTQI